MTVVIQTVARTLLAPLLVLAAAALVKAYSDTGDGFSAGLIAALAVLIQTVAFGRQEMRKFLPLRRAPWLLGAGLLLSLALTFLPPFAGQSLDASFPATGAPVLHLGRFLLHTAILSNLSTFLIVAGFTLGVLETIGRRGEDA